MQSIIRRIFIIADDKRNNKLIYDKLQRRKENTYDWKQIIKRKKLLNEFFIFQMYPYSLLESGEKRLRVMRIKTERKKKGFSEAEFQLLHPLKIERNIRIP